MSFGFEVRCEAGAVHLTHLRSGRMLRRLLLERFGMKLRVARNENAPKV